MDILVLGGTGWLGGEMVREALRRGHDVTCLARGSGPAPEGAHLVRADRDEPQALAPVAGRRWDAVVDVTDQPGRVREAVRELRTAHWVYVSSASVYAESREVDRSEDAPVLEPLAADRYEDMGDYGAAKLACERAVLTGGTPAAVVRAGLIGGPGDESGRSGYWPWRFAHPSGPDVLVPDDPDLPTAFVDVRDLALWLVAVAETGTAGVLNATGGTTTLGSVLEAARQVAGGDVDPRPVDPAHLLDLGVAPWAGPCSMPLWLPMPELRGFATLDTSRARSAGLTTRPLVETLRDVLAWEVDGRTRPRGAGLSDEEEQQVRARLDGAGDL